MSRFVTTTLTAPGVSAGVTAVIEVAETKTTLVAATPPMVTDIPVINPVPVIVTAVPPANAPTEGDTDATVGAGA